MKGFLVATFVLASIASAVKAQPPVYFTSFETPNYVVGQPIDGVDGWVAAASPLAPEIVCDQAVVSHGRRALQRGHTQVSDRARRPPSPNGQRQPCVCCWH